jgi:branched-chain amino acid transport system substrate-binding protein
MATWMRTIAAAVVAGLVVCGCSRTETPAAGGAGATPAAGTAAPTIKIGAIFAVTGGAAFLGLPEKNTAEMLEKKINAAGGINGAKIQVIIKDSAGENDKAISAARQLIEEEKVVAIIGPTRSPSSLAIKSTCEQAKVPNISCAAAESIVLDAQTNVVPRYIFKSPQKDSHVAQVIFKTMKGLGIKKIGVIAEAGGFGDGGKLQLAKYAPENGIEIVASESFDPKAADLTPIVTKVQAAGVQAVVNWSIVPAQSQIPKIMKQIGFNVPIFHSHGFGNIRYVEAAGEAAEGIIFPCGRLLIAEELPDDHPQKTVLIEYKKDYQAAYPGEQVSTFGGHCYDAFMILVEAIKKAGPDREKIRDALERMRFVGTAGVFQFSDRDHNGLGIDSLEVLTVKGGKFVQYMK